MRSLKILALSVIVAVGVAAQAWKEVGNAAGISEQNLIYAMKNADVLLSQVGKILTTESDQAYLREFLLELPKVHLEFEYAANTTHVFAVKGAVWVLYSVNLLQYDSDGNGVLSLKESYRLLLEVFASDKVLPATFKDFEQNVLMLLGSMENTRILKAYSEEIQWTELASDVYLFYADLKPLKLNAKVLKPRLCAGELSDLRLYNPSLAMVQSREHAQRMVITVDSYCRCDGKAEAKRLMLDLLAEEGNEQLLLR